MFTGSIVYRLRDKTSKQFSEGSRERSTVEAMLDWADQGSGASLPKGNHHAPTTRLVRVHNTLFAFFRLFEGHLQRVYLTAAKALQHATDLFSWIALQLPTDHHVRSLWSDVVTAAENELSRAHTRTSPWDGISPRGSVAVLQALVWKYMLSKQRTWRVGKGLHVEAVNQVALRTMLRAQALSASKKQWSAREDAAGLARGALESILDGSKKLSKAAAATKVRDARDAGAVAIAQDAQRGRALGSGSSTSGGAAARAADELPDLQDLLAAYGKGTLDRVHSYAVVLLQSDHGFKFEAVATGLADKQVCRISDIDAGVTARSLTIGAPGQAARVGDYVIDVMSRRRSGDDRSLSTNVLVGDGRKKAQFPVTLIVLAHESTLLRGLPPPPAPKHRRAVVTVPAGAGGAAGAGGGSGAPVAHTPARRTSTATTPAGKGPTGSAKKRANDTPGDDPDPDAPPARRLRGPAALALGAGSAAPSGAGAGAGAPVAPTPARQHSKKRHHAAATPGADPVHQGDATPARHGKRQRA
jgi:hypothetical protein